MTAILNDQEFAEQLLAGSTATATDGSKKLMVDLLHDRFGADDLVKIKNFTNFKTGWVYSDRRTLRVEQPNEYTRRVYQGDQKVRVLNPGDDVIVAGWEAYVGLVRFYKQYVATEFGSKMSVMMNSPESQKEFIDKAFVGIYDPNKPEAVVDVKKEVEKDLGLTEEPVTVQDTAPQFEEEPDVKEKEEIVDIPVENVKKTTKKDLGLVDEKPKAK